MNITKESAVGWMVLASACAAIVIGGCAEQKHHHPKAPASEPVMTMQERLQRHLDDLRSAVADFQQQANALPGADDAEHRQIMERVFDDLSVALPILVGEQPSGAFRLQMRSVQSAREELASDPSLAPEPIEDSGLRAAVAAMGRIAHEEFYGSSERATDRIRLSLRPLDNTVGPMHRLVVRDVVREMAVELRRLAERYEDRVVATPQRHHKHTSE